MVSVVITTYNRKRVLPNAIESALRQYVTDREVIVVDDGSTDGTEAEIRRRYGERVRYLTRPNGGPPAARNTGLAAAAGTWIALLDSDDWWEPSYLESQLAVLAAHPGADLVMCDGRRQGAGGRWHTMSMIPDFVFPDSIEAMCAGSWMQPSFTLIRASVARELGFDERFRVGDDQEFMWRFVKAGHRAVHNPDSPAEYRLAEGQLSEDTDRIMLGSYDVWRHHSATHPQVLRRGLDFDRAYGELLVRHGRGRDARPHLWRWWRAEPYRLQVVRLLFRSVH